MFQSIAFIGLGVMGQSMAKHLSKHTSSLFVHSRTKSKVSQSLLELENVKWFDSIEELMKSQPQVVVTCLGYPTDVRDVYFNKLLPNSQQGMIFIDCTTSEATLAQEIFTKGSKIGVECFDVPVSGGDIGAREARLIAFVGGNEDKLESVKQVLQAFCRNIHYFGASGSGQHAKTSNQIFIATSMIGVVEGLIYAYKAGLNVEKVIEACSGGAAQSFSLTSYGPRILKRDMAPGFYIEHFVKDMKIALESCEKMNLDLPGLKLAKSLYENLVQEGHGKKGTQALILALEKLNNLELKIIK